MFVSHYFDIYTFTLSQQFGKRAWVAGDIVVCGECFKDST